jgi:SAM-dependent methyltransferase
LGCTNQEGTVKFTRQIARKLRAFSWSKATFEQLLKQERVCLYAGDVPKYVHYEQYIGLSLSQSNRQHIRHDVTARLPLPDACVDIYQSEDVFEHIDPTLLPAIVDEIYRVLKPGGIFRLSVPDYRCDLLQARTLKDEGGELIFDPGGGGSYKDGKVVGGGHVWFPRYESVKAVIEATRFTDVTFYHYYDRDGQPVTKPIDYSFGYVMRTPDHDSRVGDPYRPMSIVLDCRKSMMDDGT